jgi:hypothetical protein
MTVEAFEVPPIGGSLGPSGPPPKAAGAGSTASKPERPAAKLQEREAQPRFARGT